MSATTTAKVRRLKPNLTEAQIERQCTDYLRGDGWRPLKTDPVSDKSRGKGFGEIGMADYLYIRYCPSPKERHHDRAVTGGYGGWDPVEPCQAEIMWIEWKSSRGTAAYHQKTWHLLERKRGALTLIAGQDFERSFDGFVGWYRASGLLRRVGY